MIHLDATFRQSALLPRTLTTETTGPTEKSFRNALVPLKHPDI
jgi:hypothetical protein